MHRDTTDSIVIFGQFVLLSNGRLPRPRHLTAVIAQLTIDITRTVLVVPFTSLPFGERYHKTTFILHTLTRVTHGAQLTVCHSN